MQLMSCYFLKGTTPFHPPSATKTNISAGNTTNPLLSASQLTKHCRVIGVSRSLSPTQFPSHNSPSDHSFPPGKSQMARLPINTVSETTQKLQKRPPTISSADFEKYDHTKLHISLNPANFVIGLHTPSPLIIPILLCILLPSRQKLMLQYGL